MPSEWVSIAMPYPLLTTTTFTHSRQPEPEQDPQRNREPQPHQLHPRIVESDLRARYARPREDWPDSALAIADRIEAELPSIWPERRVLDETPAQETERICRDMAELRKAHIRAELKREARELYRRRVRELAA